MNTWRKMSIFSRWGVKYFSTNIYLWFNGRQSAGFHREMSTGGFFTWEAAFALCNCLYIHIYIPTYICNTQMYIVGGRIGRSARLLDPEYRAFWSTTYISLSCSVERKRLEKRCSTIVLALTAWKIHGDFPTQIKYDLKIIIIIIVK